MTRTEQLLEEAEILLAKHKQEMEDNPDSFAHKVTYRSFSYHVQDLRRQVEEEKELDQVIIRKQYE